MHSQFFILIAFLSNMRNTYTIVDKKIILLDYSFLGREEPRSSSDNLAGIFSHFLYCSFTFDIQYLHTNLSD